MGASLFRRPPQKKYGFLFGFPLKLTQNGLPPKNNIHNDCRPDTSTRPLPGLLGAFHRLSLDIQLILIGEEGTYSWVDFKGKTAQHSKKSGPREGLAGFLIFQCSWGAGRLRSCASARCKVWFQIGEPTF